MPSALNPAEGASAAPPGIWHCLSAEEVSRRFEADLERGLTEDKVAAGLAKYGPNALPDAERRSLVRMVFDQLNDFMIVVLIVAAVVSGFVGDPGDTIAIAVIVILNAVIGFLQDYRAEKAMAALKKMASPLARVMRAGSPANVASEALVPGDLVLLEAGNVVPADLRILEVAQLRVSEAALTGESEAVEKSAGTLTDREASLGDRFNMAYRGTIVVYGRATGMVVATGSGTELGRIAGLLAGPKDTHTPLQRRLARFGARLAWSVLGICGLVFLLGMLRGEPAVPMFLTAISLAVAAIPEALPAVVTIALALGASRMVKQHALIRRLPAVETLGSITYICTDKTGTLTENRMSAEVVVVDGVALQGLAAATDPHAEPWRSFYRALMLCNDATEDAAGVITGDPTETALLQVAKLAGYDKRQLEGEAPRIREVPFDAERKRMATLHGEDGAVVSYVKGAPEAILPQANRRMTANGPAALDAGAVLDEAHRLAARGLRVLAIAMRRFDALPERLEEAESELVFLGLVGLIDPPRAEAAAAVAECKAAGITTVMVTGDHPETARAIALRLGIVEAGGRVLTGVELAHLSEEALALAVRDVRVYARVDPEQKIRIVQALQAKGELVAMTGDGVNDAPALKRADIGVAMGKGGTDVARESADVVLLDDNFATIVGAVREGRRIFDNIRKFLKYSMTGNAGTVWTIFLAPFVGLPIPLLPIQILWINLATDGMPGLALANERAERNLMQRAPRAPDESMFAHGMGLHILSVGLAIALICLPLQAWAYHGGNPHWQTMIFTVLCFARLAQCIAISSDSRSVFTLGFWSNPVLLGTVLLTVALHLATIYVPALNPVFKTEPLSAAELALCFAAALLVFVIVEIEKWLVRHGYLYA